MIDFKFQGVPTEAIPPLGAKARIMLDLYLTGEEIPEQKLCDLLGLNFRSVLQRLRGDRYLNWNLITITQDGEIFSRYLDSRHLSGDRNMDALARAERKQQLKEESLNVAILGADRVKFAYEDFKEADIYLAELKKLTVK